MTSFFKVTDRQWFGLILSIMISMLIWWELVFITHTNDDDEMKIGKMQWCGLGLSIIIGALGWFKTVNIVDK